MERLLLERTLSVVGLIARGQPSQIFLLPHLIDEHSAALEDAVPPLMGVLSPEQRRSFRAAGTARRRARRLVRLVLELNGFAPSVQRCRLGGQHRTLWCLGFLGAQRTEVLAPFLQASPFKRSSKRRTSIRLLESSTEPWDSSGWRQEGFEQK